MSLKRIVIGCVLVVLCFYKQVSAVTPNQFNYEGKYFPNGVPFTGSVSLRLCLYDSVTDGNCLYEDSNTVEVVDGAYTTFIGDSTVFGSLTNALASVPAYVSVIINSEELLPRETFIPTFIGQPSSGRSLTRVNFGAEYAEGELLVRFDKGLKHRSTRLAVVRGLGAASIKKEFNIVPGLALVKLEKGVKVEQARSRFKAVKGVIYAEPNYILKAFSTPNDTYFTNLWGMYNTGQTGGTPGADIHAAGAWEMETGSARVVVAVIDTGVDYNHEELSANMWHNLGEIPGNKHDDDGNGYVDDVYGINVVSGTGNPIDNNGHGTHVAGTIGAVGNNGAGVAGVVWGTQIMALKFLNSQGAGYEAGAIECIEYAVHNGARVLNNSWGGGGYSQPLKDAIDMAGTSNVLFVAAANNYGTDNDRSPQYPASFDSENIVSVMATDNNDARAWFSCYGTNTVDLGAPGESILSCKLGGGYEVMSGTSMATPHVAGGAALYMEHNPMATMAGVKQALIETCDVPSPPLACRSKGRINIDEALRIGGNIWFDQPTYFTRSWACISVLDPTNKSAGTLNVQVSTSGGDAETLALYENPNTPGVFTNRIWITNGITAVAGNGKLEGTNGTRLKAVSVDPGGQRNTLTNFAWIDLSLKISIDPPLVFEVPGEVTAWTATGNNNGNVRVNMVISNTATGEAIPFEATNNWTAPTVGIVTDRNIIMIFGTNEYGYAATNEITVIKVGPSGITNYVSATGSHQFPFVSWETAATNIQSAINAAAPNNLVLVTNGVYDSGENNVAGNLTPSRILLYKPITVASVNGPTQTVIQGYGPDDEFAIRCAYLNEGAVLVGFTLTNGYTRSPRDDWDTTGYGGGAYLSSGGTVTNCLIHHCGASWGGGAYLCSKVGMGRSALASECGLITDCEISHNAAIRGGDAIGMEGDSVVRQTWIYTNGLSAWGGCHSEWGAVYAWRGGLIEDCIIERNDSGIKSQPWVEDIEPMTTVNRCTVRYHESDDYESGGGVYNCTVSNSFIIFNVSKMGGGVHSSKAVNCDIIYNYALGNGSGGFGGGAYQSILAQCRIGHNYASCGGGGASQSALSRCSIDGNSCSQNGSAGGGIRMGTASDSLIINNSAYGGGGSSMADLRNCTVVNNTGANGGIGGVDGGSVLNSIIYSNYANVYSNYRSTSIVYSCTQPLPAGIGNITNAPSFRDWSAGDYRMAVNSPCIDRGANTLPLGADVDMDGVPRPLDGDNDSVAIVDMGAYEYFNADTDTDGDGLPDTWEFQHSLNPWSGFDDSLVGWWRLDDGTGTNAVNSAVNAYSGELKGFAGTTNSGWVSTGKLGGALQFDGVDDWIRIAQSPSMLTGGSFTVSAWAWLDASCMSDWPEIVSDMLLLPTGHYNGYCLGFTSDTAFGMVDDTIIYDTDALVDQWVWVSLEYDGQAVRLYRNGQLMGTQTNVIFTSAVNSSFAIGDGQDSGVAEEWMGVIDDVRLYRTAIGTNGLAAMYDVWSDPDTDGLSNMDEYQAGTDPHNPDTDGDDLNDSAEMNDYGTDPLNADTDEDWLSDYIEVNTDTDPLIADTDADGFMDGVEVSRGSDPLNPDSTPSVGTIFVDAGRPNDVGYATNWATAKKTIQAAVDISLPGETVLVTNGVYGVAGRAVCWNITNRVAIDRPITVRSVSGPEVTVIQGQGPNGDCAVRCAYIGTNAILDGFTLTNGATYVSGNGSNIWGGGAWCEVSGIVTNCIIVGNMAVNGGGSYGGTLNNCVFVGNSATQSGGGAYRSILNRCALTGNSAITSGGGVNGGTINHCVLTGNSASAGGAAAFATLYNSTLTENSASEAGGGAAYCTLKNCIVYNNEALSAANYTEGWLNYCCTVPLPSSGTGNIEAVPSFIGDGDYRLQLGSPCIDAGNNAYMPSGPDLNCIPRPLDGDANGMATVDMGAYEYVNVAADSDGDGNPDGWEFQYGLNPVVDDAAGDVDEDGLDNASEYAWGTNPLMSDSDEDGLSDGEEVNDYYTDPLDADTDDDGLSDGEEVNDYGTDPLESDTDEDGLSDGDEVNMHGTDPTDTETDKDGMPDGWEVQHDFNPKSGPAARLDWFRFDEGTGVAVRTTCNSFTGVLLNAAATNWVRGYTGGSNDYALWFDGANDYVSVPTNLYRGSVITQGPFSVSAWIYQDPGMNKRWGAVFSDSGWYWPSTNGPQYMSGYSLRVDTNYNSACYFVGSPTNSGACYRTSWKPTRGGRWVLVVGTYTGTTMKLYVDGVLAQTAQAVFAPERRPQLWIGRGHVNAESSSWQGAIDDVRFYDCALSTQDVAALHEPYADADSDGLSNLAEFRAGTNPQNPDTDGDELTDGEEIHIFGTDPLDPDTDADGLSDFSELDEYGTNPLVADTDGDGLSDGEEVNEYVTDPLVDDTDGDDLSDGEEVNQYGTDPLEPDTDGDGLPDGWEVQYDFDALSGMASTPAVWWRFDESSGTNIYNYAGTNYNGCMFGMASTSRISGVSGGALWFDGTNDMVVIPQSPGIVSNPSFTVSALAWLDGNSTSDCPTVIADTYLCSGNYPGFWLGAMPGTAAQVGGYSNYTWDMLMAQPTGRWHHVAMTYNGTNLVVYQGTNKSLYAYEWSGFHASTQDVYIGWCADPSYSYRWKGLIDNVRIYREAFSYSQITNLYVDTWADADGDGQSNLQEYRDGTNPRE